MNKTKAKNKRIAIIFPKDSSAIFDGKSTETFGGATVQMFLLAKEFSNYDDIDVSCLVVNFGRKDGEVINGLKIYNTFSKKDNLFIKIIKFHKAIHKVKTSVIIQHGLTIFSCLLAVYCKVFGTKFVYMFASDVESDGCYQRTNKKALLFKLLIRCADVLITQNQYQYRKIFTDYSRKTNILYSGFPIKKLLNTNRDFMLWIGRAEKLKNPLKFIDLASLNPDHKFVMVCNNSVGLEDYFDRMKYLADGVKNIEFISHVPFSKINAYFRGAKLLVNTSDYEGFPQVFIQAAMNNVPIISLNVNPDNFITKYNCGVVCDGDELFMNQSIQSVIRDPQKYNQLSKNAYNYAKENHDIKKNVRMLYDLIFNGRSNEKE
jgi:glycosyltransferase involved in cell wall biosynthesis